MKIFYAILMLVVMLGSSCRSRNDEFNPFDDEFKFHNQFDIAEYDTIMTECGYWNLTNRKDGSYYQFYADEPEITGKGFYVDLFVAIIDTTKINFNWGKVSNVLNANPIDLAALKNKLSNFHFKNVTNSIVRKEQGVIDINTGEFLDSIMSPVIIYRNDSIYPLDINPYLDGNRLIRSVGYSNLNQAIIK